MRASDGVDSQNKTIKNINAFDKQISTANHDEIMLWLYKKLETDGEMLRALFDEPSDQDMSDLVIKIEFALPPKSSGRGYEPPSPGFADLFVSVFVGPVLTDEQHADNEAYQVWREKTGSYGGEYTGPKTHRKPSYKGLFIEVKTSVNIGETVRQINYYKDRMGIYRNEKWLVCAPAFEGSDFLLKQGIGFIEYKP